MGTHHACEELSQGSAQNNMICGDCRLKKNLVMLAVGLQCYAFSIMLMCVLKGVAWMAYVNVLILETCGQKFRPESESSFSRILL